MKLKERIILHCDANNFFASVECANNSSLKGKAVVVSGNVKKRTGIIYAKNEIAKKHGIKTGDAIWEAKLKCPDLVCVPPNPKMYEYYSRKLKEIYYNYTDIIEPFGIDECWLDITESMSLFESPLEVATMIRNQVKETLGITVSVGISFCKLFAKLASDFKKPDATTIIDKSNFKELIYPLPLNAIIGIGRRLEKAFNKLNVFTLGEITTLSDKILKQRFGIIGTNLKQNLLGFQDEEVQGDFIPPKSIGNGTTTTEDISSKEELENVVRYLAEKISYRLREQNYNAKSLSVSIKNNSFVTTHHSKILDYRIQTTDEIVKETLDYINSFWDYKESIRSIRICCSQLESSLLKQVCLFENYELLNKKELLQVAIDTIRKKYGTNIIDFATLTNCEYLNKRF